ncbi:hypothetical protein NDI44_08645 [Trichocoleus sp. DQ-A3]|uniref:hypothetical protein n=1 Tax=Cyanophyceae TaxID=3028117 RepID=UPI0016893EA3|nr:hypothetical protein [Coleofasciculus sp. FACHB-125]MBD1899259.1 hypothetical protein [Coleofasciculus sp. FACHB-125]
MPISNPGSTGGIQTFDDATNTTVTLLANTAALVLAANPLRKYFSIVNNGAFDVTVVLGGTTAEEGATTGVTLGSGIILKGGGGSVDPGFLVYTGQISAICAAATSLAVVEGT